MADGTIDVSISGGVSAFRYRWSTSDTTEDLSGLVAGTYELTYVDASGCVRLDTFEVFDGQPTSLDQTLTPSFHIYPSPAREKLIIQATDMPLSRSWNLSLHSLNGQIVWSEQDVVMEAQTSYQLSLQGLTSGLYVLKISGEGGNWSEKVWIETSP